RQDSGPAERQSLPLRGTSRQSASPFRLGLPPYSLHRFAIPHLCSGRLRSAQVPFVEKTNGHEKAAPPRARAACHDPHGQPARRRCSSRNLASASSLTASAASTAKGARSSAMSASKPRIVQPRHSTSFE